MKNYVEKYYKAKLWIEKNTVCDGGGIAVTDKNHKLYPEVTGYYIPSLLEWGERERALSYAKYLCDAQKEDGSWWDSDGKAPYVFDSAQILKGLIAVRELMPTADSHILKGCEWILSNMQPDGRLTTPDRDAWGDDDGFCNELIHIYCLSPIKEAGKIFDKPEFCEAAEKILDYYISNYKERILNFSLFSHFYAYVCEGLVDMGRRELATQAMDNLLKYCKRTGAVRALNNVSWVCSTSLFQFAIVWYKLGKVNQADKTFDYAMRLQNPSGGWYGSYPDNKLDHLINRKKRPYYFTDSEISWANKFFLDALYYSGKCNMERQADSFLETLDDNDGRYAVVRAAVESSSEPGGKILETGCGKGRYIKRLLKEIPNRKYCGMDISQNVMNYIKEDRIELKTGTLTRLPYEDSEFDVVYSCEAIEHAVDIENAVTEMIRVLKSGGTAVIIDKPVEKLGQLEIEVWEQWIDTKQMQKLAEKLNCTLKLDENCSYERNAKDGLFSAWSFVKR